MSYGEKREKCSEVAKDAEERVCGSERRQTKREAREGRRQGDSEGTNPAMRRRERGKERRRDPSEKVVDL